jgi:hypothetical protein
MNKNYDVALSSEQISLILKIANLRGNQLMSRHTRSSDWELGQIDALVDFLCDALDPQTEEVKL